MPDETKKKGHTLTALDAVRLLCAAIQKVQYFDKEQEGISPPCRDPGEYMLADALEYLAWGDTPGTRQCMEIYDEWKATGVAPWPYDGGPPPS